MPARRPATFSHPPISWVNPPTHTLCVAAEAPSREPEPGTVEALLDYYRPLAGRRWERLTGLRTQSGTLIQTTLTLYGLLLVVLVVQDEIIARRLGAWIALAAGVAYAASVWVQLGLHATKTVHEMPNDDQVFQAQLESTRPQVQQAELASLRTRLSELKARHGKDARAYRRGFILFLAGTLVVGLGAAAWLVKEVNL